MKKSKHISSELPQRGLSGTSLKYIGAVLMVFDHLHQFFLAYGAPTWFNMLGRLVLPIFLFMVAEGFFYTRDRLRYLKRLLFGFLIMSLLNLILSWTFPITHLSPELTPQLMNNVFSTMLFSGFYILIIDQLIRSIKDGELKKVAINILLLLAPLVATALVTGLQFAIPNFIVFILLSFIPNILAVEGGFLFVILGVLFYYLRRWQWAQFLALAAFSLLSFLSGLGHAYNIQWIMIFAIIPLWFYNGKRGGTGSKFDKYFFYIFYPVHIYAFYLIAWFLQR